jgi:hypothetical protein
MDAPSPGGVVCKWTSYTDEDYRRVMREVIRDDGIFDRSGESKTVRRVSVAGGLAIILGKTIGPESLRKHVGTLEKWFVQAPVSKSGAYMHHTCLRMLFNENISQRALVCMKYQAGSPCDRQVSASSSDS